VAHGRVRAVNAIDDWQPGFDRPRRRIERAAGITLDSEEFMEYVVQRIAMFTHEGL